MAHYIDRNEYHAEIEKSYAKNQLTPRAVEMYQLHAKEVSKLFYFPKDEDREDAVSYAMMDFLRYWKGIKVYSVRELKLKRNFVEGDEIEITIEGYGTNKMVPKFEVTNKEVEFKIGETENKSLDHLAELINRMHKGHISASLHKVTRKINLVDDHNKQATGSIGKVKVTHGNDQLMLQEIDEYEKILDLDLKDPSNSFNYLTSLARNAIIKYINEYHPKEIRNGKLIHFSQINSDGETGAYNV